ncbi:MAG: hypothetical protein ACLUHE_04725 [Christensenellales bacterium]
MRPEREACSSRWRAWDGCGKTTQRAALTEHLQKLGWRVTATREPGGDEVAGKDPQSAARPGEPNHVRRDGSLSCMRPVVRRMCARWCVRRWNAATAVVCDRSVDSSVAYQGAGAAAGHGTGCRAQRDEPSAKARPDITVYLRMPADVARFPEGSARPSRTGWNSRKPTFSAARIRRMNGSLRAGKARVDRQRRAEHRAGDADDARMGWMSGWTGWRFEQWQESW